MTETKEKVSYGRRDVIGLALFAAGFHLLDRYGPRLVLPAAAAALWVGLDWLRSWLFSGFPWMDIGYGLWSQPRLLQIADLAFPALSIPEDANAPVEETILKNVKNKRLGLY